MAHGPSYDMEVVAKEQKMEDEEEEADLAITQYTRRIVNGCYDNIEHVQPDACTYMLQVSTGRNFTILRKHLPNIKSYCEHTYCWYW